MRLISQNASPYVDIPYESCVIETTENYGRYLITATSDNTYPMAIYSSKEKALKVMKMLRMKYEDYASTRGGTNAFTGVTVQPNMWVLPKVLQFPKDEEV